MDAKNTLLSELIARYPSGIEATLRYGLHVALGVDSYGPINEYVPRLTVLKHPNGFGEIRIDYQDAGTPGQLVFALSVEKRGDYRSNFDPVRETYFGEDGEQKAMLNRLERHYSFAHGGIMRTTFSPDGSPNEYVVPPSFTGN